MNLISKSQYPDFTATKEDASTMGDIDNFTLIEGDNAQHFINQL